MIKPKTFILLLMLSAACERGEASCDLENRAGLWVLSSTGSVGNVPRSCSAQCFKIPDRYKNCADAAQKDNSLQMTKKETGPNSAPSKVKIDGSWDICFLSHYSFNSAGSSGDSACFTDKDSEGWFIQTLGAMSGGQRNCAATCLKFPSSIVAGESNTTTVAVEEKRQYLGSKSIANNVNLGAEWDVCLMSYAGAQNIGAGHFSCYVNRSANEWLLGSTGTMGSIPRDCAAPCLQVQDK